ncbi:unnamed protein product [Sphagnum jensenii]
MQEQQRRYRSTGRKVRKRLSLAGSTQLESGSGRVNWRERGGGEEMGGSERGCTCSIRMRYGDGVERGLAFLLLVKVLVIVKHEMGWLL